MKRSLVILAAMMLVLGMTATARAADEPPTGKKLFLDNKCNSCHTIASQGVEKRSAAAAEATEAKEGEAKEAAATSTSKRKVPDLGGVGIERKADWLTKYLQKLETIDGKKHMKKFAGTDADLATLTAWLASLQDSTAGSAMMENEKAESAAKTAGEAKDAGTEKKTEGESK